MRARGRLAAELGRESSEVRDETRFGSRSLQPVTLGSTRVQFGVYRHGKASPELRPLVIVHSIDFPSPPSSAFCQRMRESGFQIIYVSRLGFYPSSEFPDALLAPGLIEKRAPLATEATLLSALIDELQLKNVILLAMGSANPVCFRLSKIQPEISFSVFSNAMFNQEVWDVFRPRWFQLLLKRAVQSHTAMRFGVSGVKHQLRRDPLAFYRRVLEKSAGDVTYLTENEADFVQASRLITDLPNALINYDVQSSMLDDPYLADGYFEGTNAVALTGLEAAPDWQAAVQTEAERVRLPIAFAPEGDFFAPYASPDHFISLIKRYG